MKNLIVLFLSLVLMFSLMGASTCSTTGTNGQPVLTDSEIALIGKMADAYISSQAAKNQPSQAPTKPVEQPKTEPLPNPTPQPSPPVEPQPSPTEAKNYVIWDGDKVPDQMRVFVTGNWSENQLFWALFTCYGSHVGDFSPDAAELGAQCGKIRDWFTGYVDGIGRQLKSNPGSTAVLIVNDRNDAGGLFMVDPIRSQLVNMGVNPAQLRDGDVYRP